MSRFFYTFHHIFWGAFLCCFGADGFFVDHPFLLAKYKLSYYQCIMYANFCKNKQTFKQNEVNLNFEFYAPSFRRERESESDREHMRSRKRTKFDGEKDEVI